MEREELLEFTLLRANTTHFLTSSLSILLCRIETAYDRDRGRPSTFKVKEGWSFL